MKAGESELARLVGLHFRASGLTLAVAEGATGGRIGERLVRHPGASAFFLGAVVTYGRQSRTELLGVPEEMLQAYGTVSEQAARAMAEGVRRRFGSGVGFASTGVAGPTGGTPAKPVGLVWMALASSQSTHARQHLVRGLGRAATQQAFTVLALQWLSDFAERR